MLLGSIHNLEVDASDLTVTVMVHVVTVHECRGSLALSFACRDQGCFLFLNCDGCTLRLAAFRHVQLCDSRALITYTRIPLVNSPILFDGPCDECVFRYSANVENECGQIIRFRHANGRSTGMNVDNFVS